MSTIAEQLKTIAENIPKVYEAGQINSIGVTAAVGQTIIVKEVDENGKPTKWEAASYQERTHWTDETVILPETTAEVDAEEGLATLPDFTLVGGAEYTVKYNGTEYVCECVASDNDGDGAADTFALGNLSVADESISDTGEPFIILYEGAWFLWPFDGSTSVTVSIVERKDTPIPEKYVTNAFPYYVDVAVEQDESLTSTSRVVGYSTTETVANLRRVYESGRTVIAKAVFIDYVTTGNPSYTAYYTLSQAYELNNGWVVFTFVRPQENTSTPPWLSFFPQEDGTYSVEGSK